MVRSDASKAQQKAARAQQKNKRKAERKAEDSAAYARAAAGFFRAMQLHGKLCCQSGGNGWDGHGVSAAGG